MALKRKRSSCDVSPSSSTSSFSPPSDPVSPTPVRQFPNAVSMDLDTNMSFCSAGWTYDWEDDTRYGLNSRTRKRFRDNRPDEDVIHKNTLQKLFGAQKQTQDTTSAATSPLDSSSRTISRPQRTLHAFWTLPHQAMHFPTSTPELSTQTCLDDLRCNDCDGSLRDDNAMDIDSNYIVEESRCHICQRSVCDMCSVGVASMRRCLRCSS
ncbi:hypothetical protein BT63DRAFT_481377 [Microthyrium microscopicum]|uniref:Uncharacterized protein n=1 Tax=Microthyrium microscopicum TaxID=703497 RepID=A0A6A6U5L3_9PEZI|nr:hypothetical protein BT63DRAFT_481377 [Microthyrium microscopicum]